MQNEYTVSEELQEELQRFFSYYDPALLSQHLRRLFIDYLDYELKIAVPLYFDEFLFPFNCLLDLLDKAGKEFSTPGDEEQTQPATLTNQPTKEKVIAFVTASVSPEKIFMLPQQDEDGSANNCFDLIVVIPETSKTSFNQYEQVIALANIDNTCIHASLHKTITLQQQLAEGNIFYSLACCAANLVYDNNPNMQLQPNMEALQEQAAKANEVFAAAHKKAESFLEGAADIYGERDTAMMVFMLQQGVELTLRGLILALSGHCMKTHCFRDLKRQLKRYLPELAYIFSNDETEEMRLLNILEKAYLETRYSNEFTISDNDVHLLATGAEELHERAQELFEGRMQQLNL